MPIKRTHNHESIEKRCWVSAAACWAAGNRTLLKNFGGVGLPNDLIADGVDDALGVRPKASLSNVALLKGGVFCEALGGAAYP
jgi:hypothetical protein